MPHLCLAVGPPEQAAKLRELNPAEYQWFAADSWDDALAAVQASPVAVGVVDPLLDGDAGIASVEQLRAQFPSLPLVLYTTLTPAMAGVLLRLGRAGVHRVVFVRFEDAPGNLRRVIATELERAAAHQVMRLLEPAFRGLPAPLRLALEQMLHTPGERVNVSTLAETAGLGLEECRTWFARAHLPTPRVVMVLTRLLYAHRLLLDPGYTIDDVARKLGYGKTRTLQVQLRAVFSMTARELRESLSAEDAGRIVTTRYFAPPAPIPSDRWKEHSLAQTRASVR
jgi:AraC-like DNA-binding protein